MNLIYNFLTYIVTIITHILARFYPKIRLFVNGRRETFNKLSVLKKKDKVIWFHTASLGEFEQGRPIIEKIKKEFSTHKIVITFFSPSGYEVRNDYTFADVVCYLPLDTKYNMKKFVESVHPDIAIIVKYEFWPNLLTELKKKKIHTILVSGIFREKQSFFKFYGGWMRKKLEAFNHFFVQNNVSKALLNSIHFNNVTISGDTRFDRVYEILLQNNQLDFISEFTNNKYTLVAGSTWKDDEKLLVNYINTTASKDEKFIIAPHNINPKGIEQLKALILKKTILYSNRNNVNIKEYPVLIIDTIGILTKIYSYADVAYVGGGFTTGLHNILEPAAFGIPVVFGGNEHYKKFNEAIDLIELNGCINIQNQKEFSSTFTTLKSNTNFRKETGNINKQYIKDNIGATSFVVEYISSKLK